MLTQLACYIPRQYTRPKTVTHPGTNRARRALTSFIRRTPLTTTPRRQPRRGQAPKYFGLEPALWTAFFLHCGRDSVELFRGSFADPDLRTESSTTARLFRQHGPCTSETTRRRQDYSPDHGLQRYILAQIRGSTARSMSRDLCARVIGGNVEPRGHAGQLIPSVRGAGHTPH